MKKTRKVFKYQIWHLLLLIIFLISIYLVTANFPEILSGSLWGINTKIWFWFAIAVPIAHQVYVWLIWRLELYHRTFTKRFGLDLSFKVYTIGFSILFSSRLISILFLAFSNENTLPIHPALSYALATLITPLVIYLFYSVKKYFTFERAYGIDHFDENYKEPFVIGGIFKYTNNGMYIFGLTVLYLPGLLLLSEAAILAALFNHIYIWLHYFFTERPDMLEIYGDTP